MSASEDTSTASDEEANIPSSQQNEKDVAESTPSSDSNAACRESAIFRAISERGDCFCVAIIVLLAILIAWAYAPLLDGGYFTPELVPRSHVIRASIQAPVSIWQPKIPSRQDVDELSGHIARLLEECSLILQLTREKDLEQACGLFNEPIDQLAMKIPTYQQITKEPRDLRTISR